MGDIDQFTQRFLESAQNRSKKLGISNMSKVPLTENNVNVTKGTTPSKTTTASSPSKHCRSSPSLIGSPTMRNRGGSLLVEKSNKSLNIDGKENDLAVEINITTGSNVQVQVDVEEQEIDGDGNILHSNQKQRKQITTTEENDSASSSLQPLPPPTPSTPFMRDSSRNQLHRLGALYSKSRDLSSPVHRTEPAFTVEQITGNQETTQSGTKLKKSHRLAELANSINTWENDLPHKSRANRMNDGNDTNQLDVVDQNNANTVSGIQQPITKSPRKIAANPSILNRIESIELKETNNQNQNLNNKHLKWDKSIMNSLESQGYKRRDTTIKRLEYNFGVKSSDRKETNTKTNNKFAVQKIAEKNDPIPAKKVEVSNGLVSGRSAIFEKQHINSSTVTASASQTNKKDPAEMSLKERMALFEKNKGEALIPKAALGMAPCFNKLGASNMRPIMAPQQPIISSMHNASTVRSKVADTCLSTGSSIRQTVAKLQTASATISESRIADENRKIREQEMNVVMNRFNQHQQRPETSASSPPPAPPMPEYNLSSARKRLSDEYLDVSSESENNQTAVKRTKVKQFTPEPPYTDDDNNEQPIIERYLYNSENNDGDEESDSNSEDDMSNAGTVNSRERHVMFDSSIPSDDSESSELSKYLDEAIDSDDTDENNDRDGEDPQLKKGTLSSTSFSYERKPLHRQPETIYEDEATTSKFQSPMKSKFNVDPSDDDSSMPLTHTVSFYRRQQTEMNSPCVRKVVYAQPNNIESMRNNDDHNDADEQMKSQEDLVQNKIKSLMSNVMIQNQQIAQASNALTTCASTFEFSGSSESVVAEWKLLVATHSRKAALQEVQRLEIERCLRPADAPKECGRVTVKDIVLPLRDDYVRKVSEEKILGHHLVCLLKYNEHVLATRTYPTLPGLKSVKFPGELHLDNVYADFKITLEIYGMIAQRESLPHEIKYHIKKEKKGVIKTPKGKKAGSNLIMPPAQSPAGPNVVRAPAFIYYGFVIFSLREIQRNSWTLNQVAARDIVPLVGTVHMKINCALTVDIDHKAFLTMFEDVSGFGAWHRRWCHLHGKTLSYWKYPDDERTKPPIGSLDLSACEQTKITTAPREMCARLNTLMVELKRPRSADDVDSMLMQTKGEYTYVRYLLSADTKEERNEWCNVFNKTLALMRAWGISTEQQQQRRRSTHKY